MFIYNSFGILRVNNFTINITLIFKSQYQKKFICQDYLLIISIGYF